MNKINNMEAEINLNEEKNGKEYIAIIHQDKRAVANDLLGRMKGIKISGKAVVRTSEAEPKLSGESSKADILSLSHLTTLGKLERLNELTTNAKFRTPKKDQEIQRITNHLELVKKNPLLTNEIENIDNLISNAKSFLDQEGPELPPEVGEGEPVEEPKGK